MEEHSRAPRCRIRYKTIRDQLSYDPASGTMFSAPRWIDETTMIAHERMGDGWLIDPYLIDLKQQRVKRLVELGKRIRGSRGASWQVSPDRKWMLWPKGSPGPNHLCVTRMDGRDHREFVGVSEGIGGCFGWLAANQIVYLISDEEERQATALIYDLARSQPIRRIPLGHLAETEWAGISSKGKAVLVGLTGARQVSIRHIFSATLAGLKMNATGVQFRRTLPIATGIEYLEVTVSPTSERLLWRLGEEGKTQLAVSALDGSRFMLLGANGAFDAQWLPAGKAISFLRHNKESKSSYERDLYTLELR
jgi:hypothetical protein